MLSSLLIVTYVNLNDFNYGLINVHFWRLIYYFQYYVLVGFSIVLLWILFSNKVIRILTAPIAVYYLFHLCINYLEIFNPELKDLIYTTKTINYLLSISMAISIVIAMYWVKLTNLILYFYEKTKRFINRKPVK